MKVKLTIATLIAALCLAGCSSANTSSLASQPESSFHHPPHAHPFDIVAEGLKGRENTTQR